MRASVYGAALLDTYRRRPGRSGRFPQLLITVVESYRALETPRLSCFQLCSAVLLAQSPPADQATDTSQMRNTDSIAWRSDEPGGRSAFRAHPRSREPDLPAKIVTWTYHCFSWRPPCVARC